jgi:N-dimethylarginine dimethylaminohydrolase
VTNPSQPVRTFLMSYPGPSWQIRGGQNFRSQSRALTNPRQAGREWLTLADAIVAAGGNVVVMPPPAVDPPLTGLIYTANAGELFGDRYVLARPCAAHRRSEPDHVDQFVRGLGFATARAAHTWEGQAEVTRLPGQRYILSYGVRSARETVEQVRGHLPSEARVLSVELREPYFHGDTCLSSFGTPAGPVLLAAPTALVDRTTGDLRGFASGVEIIEVSEADALAYACNALAVGNRWITPAGVSEPLRSRLSYLGLEIVELELAELFGKGGGGPRCLVNELFGVGPLAGVAPYPNQRADIAARIDRYPEAL